MNPRYLPNSAPRNIKPEVLAANAEALFTMLAQTYPYICKMDADGVNTTIKPRIVRERIEQLYKQLQEANK